ncbi:pectin acetylesterase-family hydrolase [Archangium sp.]|uniref:pectin acetylesterase-family hydrolase n=1 Tax=Archangium sp. TaxID=1872627 RepID=UPI002D58BB57|nr:pectin acetylesterase-family hydrolase [Archangium sp.]HYO55796.1 pectin acetylesterase-family hydrolase [Archangium sp.]
MAVLTALMVMGTGCDKKSVEWSWMDVSGSTCDEGTPTGIGVNLGDSNNLFIFFNGGGACWDSVTCLQLNASTHGPFTRTQFEALAARSSADSIFDRQLANNPYKDWTMFFIPYCTGDLHVGNADAVYTLGSTSKTFHHKGRANTEAFIAHIATSFPNPEQVVVAGASAGGFGATLNYDLIRSTFPHAKVFLLDDSGPLLKNNAISPTLREAWARAWNYVPVLDAIDPVLKNDFSALYPVLARKYPNDRMALLSSEQDQTIRTYLGLSATDFQSALRDLDATVLEPLPNTRSFITTGQDHTMLFDVVSQRSRGVLLLEWLNQMQGASDADWSSVRP